MRIVQTAFGVFHSFDLARELHCRNHLRKIYSTWPWRRVQREGIPRSLVETFPWIHAPEFVLARAGLLPRWVEDQTGYANALAFDEFTRRRIPECDALIALSGSALKTGRLVQRRGGRFVCDRGSSHQRFQERILREEFRRWGVDEPVSDVRDTIREEQIYAEADAITVPSTFALRSFVEMGVPEHKVHRIPYGVRLERFQPVQEPPRESFEVVFVGGVGLRKGVPYLLQAFAHLKHPRKRLRIIGAIAREFRPVLASLPLEHVEFLGTVPQTDLPAILSSSHLLVLPSIEDGFGVVLGQAMACGCPVLCSTNTGGPDLYDDGVEGFVVPVRDVAAMTERMEMLAQDTPLQQSMRMAALARVRRLGGWSGYGDQWEALLQQLITPVAAKTVSAI